MLCHGSLSGFSSEKTVLESAVCLLADAGSSHPRFSSWAQLGLSVLLWLSFGPVSAPFSLFLPFSTTSCLELLRPVALNANVLNAEK